jgi:hypothetical protein
MKRSASYLTKDFKPTTKDKAEIVKLNIGDKIVFGIPKKEKDDDDKQKTDGSEKA